MPTDDKFEDQLRSRLEEMAEEATVEVLVYPAGSAGRLHTYLSDLQSAGDIRFNPLALHGSIAVRAPRRVIQDLAARPDVARITTIPTAGIE